MNSMSSISTIRKVARYIADEQLFDEHARIIVALSGGADSVALLRLLLRLGYTCETAHCNFHLRGEESNRDEAFVTALCSDLKVHLHIRHFDTVELATRQHLSIEMAARQLRYDWFDTLLHERHAEVIAVAHHRDDSAETLLLNLIRGAGLNGLTGIRPVNGKVVRPLLCIDRNEILDYLQHIGQSYVTDSTNMLHDYTRNKIRLELLPLMETVNPAVRETLAQTATYLNDARLLYSKGVEDAKQRILTPQGICIEALLKEVAPKTILFEILHPLGFNSAQIDNVFNALHGQSGKTFRSVSCRLIKDRTELLIVREAEVPDHGDASAPPAPPFKLSMEKQPYTNDFVVPRTPDIICVDADKLTEPLTLRLWKQGDIFVPFGMKGQKKISDYLTNRKYSLLCKEQQWVLCSGQQIVWLIGERMDNRFRIDEKTRQILIIKRC
jgi:tRNA(Ile)-lysidine synthase